MRLLHTILAVSISVILLVAWLHPYQSNQSVHETLSEVWNEVTEHTDIVNSTANLVWMHLVVSGGEVQLLHIEFTALNHNGESRVYFVDIRPPKVEVRAWSIDKVQHTLHPLEVFKELDRYGLKNIGPEYTIDVDFEWGDLEYTGPYLLTDGKLTPLEKVEFHTQTPVCNIVVCKDSCEVWLLKRDLARAEN